MSLAAAQYAHRPANKMIGILGHDNNHFILPGDRAPALSIP